VFDHCYWLTYERSVYISGAAIDNVGPTYAVHYSRLHEACHSEESHNIARVKLCNVHDW
jgi:hypothetical protein